MGPTETWDDPITKMLKKIMADIAEIKMDVKDNNQKIDDLTSKVENIETKSKGNEEATNEKFKLMQNEINKVEESVTTKLLKEIEPSLNSMKDEMKNSMCTDIRRIVQEELNLKEMKEKSADQAKTEEEHPENKKNKTHKKNKNEKPKKNEA